MEKERVVVKALRARRGGGPPTRRTGFARRIAAIFGAEAQSPSGSGWDPVPAGHPRNRPCPGPRRSFLPVSLRRKLRVLEVDEARASRPFIHLASPKGDGARAPVSSRSSEEPQPRSATHSLASLAPATGLEKRFGSPEFRKVSRRRLQRLLDKVRGRSGAARGWTEPGKS